MSTLSLVRNLFVTQLAILRAAMENPVDFDDTNRLTIKGDGTWTPTEQQVTFLLQEGMLDQAVNSNRTPLKNKLSITEYGKLVVGQYDRGERIAKPDITAGEDIEGDPTAPTKIKLAKALRGKPGPKPKQKQPAAI